MLTAVHRSKTGRPPTNWKVWFVSHRKFVGSILSGNYQPEGQASEHLCLGVKVDLLAHVIK